MKSVDLVARVQGFLTSIDYTDGAGVKQGAQPSRSRRVTSRRSIRPRPTSRRPGPRKQTQDHLDREVVLIKQADTARPSSTPPRRTTINRPLRRSARRRASSRQHQSRLYERGRPFEGVVTNHLVDVGALVGVSGPTKLATIVQLADLRLFQHQRAAGSESRRASPSRADHHGRRSAQDPGRDRAAGRGRLSA